MKRGMFYMKKRIMVTVILLLVISFMPLFSLMKPTLRYMGMGEAGIALADTQTSFHINPASLYVQPSSIFSLNVGASESIYDRDVLAANDPIPFMQHPITLLEFLFATRYSALTVGFSFNADNRAVNGNSLTFTSYNDSYIQLNVAYGFSAFSVGLYVRSGSRLQRPLISINKNNSFLDYIVQVYLNRYSPSNDGQLFTTGLGMLISYPNISLAVLTDSLFTLDEQTNELNLKARTIFENTKVGLAFKTNEFSNNNELNRFLFTSAFDISRLTDMGERTIHIGLELTIQLIKDVNIAIQTGYKENRGEPDPLFGFNWDGITSFGLSSRFNSFFLDIALLVPTSWYTSTAPSDPLNLLLNVQYQF